MRRLMILAEKGSPHAMILIGYAYFSGSGARKDDGQAEAWFGRALSNGANDAHFYLGLLHHKRQEYKQAIDYFTIGYRNEFVPSMSRLGVMYLRGAGIKSDPDKARLIWKRASDLGHVTATRHLGVLYLSGRFGLSKVPEGLHLLASSFAAIPAIVWRARSSDLTRG